jgi:enamine deaminase RidA (YjgF/YER057c/UK114 family)
MRPQRRLISTGSPFETKWGYSRAVVDGEFVFVAGTTGFNYKTMDIAADPAEQTRQCLRNIETTLKEAGASLADIVRARYYLPSHSDWDACGAVLGEVLHDVRPAATVTFCGLADPRMRIEIEVTAKVRRA